jgi:hypothetical protein
MMPAGSIVVKPIRSDILLQGMPRQMAKNSAQLQITLVMDAWSSALSEKLRKLKI